MEVSSGCLGGRLGDDRTTSDSGDGGTGDARGDGLGVWLPSFEEEATEVPALAVVLVTGGDGGAFSLMSAGMADRRTAEILRFVSASRSSCVFGGGSVAAAAAATFCSFS